MKEAKEAQNTLQDDPGLIRSSTVPIAEKSKTKAENFFEKGEKKEDNRVKSPISNKDYPRN